MTLERIAVLLGLAALVGAAALALRDLVGARERVGPSRALLPALAAAAFATTIAFRWQRLGHGPFLSMYEILASNAFSLSTALAVAGAFDARVRARSLTACLVLVVLGAWLAFVPANDTVLPPTYATPVLWLHVAASKLFLGLALLATTLACDRPLRARIAARVSASLTPGSTGNVATGELAAWQYLAAAVVAETLLLVAGAWWAQDAWGRYWDWDPLETWAFVTWAAAAAALHMRASRRWPLERTTWLIVPVFLLAFWTFFGIPFVSTAPHKGAI